MFRQTFLALSAIVSLAMGLVGSTASAQCPGPDGLNGPCWVPAQANLPQFPAATLPGTGVCWVACQPQPQLCTRVQMDPPLRTACGQYLTRVTLFDCAGQAQLSGEVHLDYTRTWDESDGMTQRRQVWRFVAKGDLRPIPGVPANPCLVPACLPDEQSAFYYGYVDYALDCSTQLFDTVIAMHHACDFYIHRNTISSVPGTYHRDTSYAFIAPSTTLNPFVASILTPPSGKLIAEAMRGTPAAAGGACVTEDRVVDGELRLLAEGCACPPMPMPGQTAIRSLVGKLACVTATGTSSSFQSLKVKPWFHLMTNSLGSWTTMTTYPGNERVWVDEGAMLVQDECAAAMGNKRNWGEIYYGASTSDGWEVIDSPVQPLSQNFTDLASNYSFALPGPAPLPWVGHVMRTRNLIYINVP